MGETKDERQDKPPRKGEEGNGVDRAFDLWLQRGLHQLYDNVAQEPLPAELLKLIEEDRGNRRDKK
jgi:hypothetical protein